MLTDFGKALRKLRIDYSLTLGGLGELLGVSAAYLSAVETGRKPVPSTLLPKLQSKLRLGEADVRGLEVAAAKQMNEVVVGLGNHRSDRAKELAVAFARRFDTMDAEEVEKMLAQLDRLK